MKKKNYFHNSHKLRIAGLTGFIPKIGKKNFLFAKPMKLGIKRISFGKKIESKYWVIRQHNGSSFEDVLSQKCVQIH